MLKKGKHGGFVMKKALSVLLAVLLAAGCLSGCKLGGKSDSDGKLISMGDIGETF